MENVIKDHRMKKLIFLMLAILSCESSAQFLEYTTSGTNSNAGAKSRAWVQLTPGIVTTDGTILSIGAVSSFSLGVFASGTDAASWRSSIGAGTSNLAIGTGTGAAIAQTSGSSNSQTLGGVTTNSGTISGGTIFNPTITIGTFTGSTLVDGFMTNGTLSGTTTLDGVVISATSSAGLPTLTIGGHNIYLGGSISIASGGGVSIGLNGLVSLGNGSRLSIPDSGAILGTSGTTDLANMATTSQISTLQGAISSGTAPGVDSTARSIAQSGTTSAALLSTINNSFGARRIAMTSGTLMPFVDEFRNYTSGTTILTTGTGSLTPIYGSAYKTVIAGGTSALQISNGRLLDSGTETASRYYAFQTTGQSAHAWGFHIGWTGTWGTSAPLAVTALSGTNDADHGFVHPVIYPSTDGTYLDKIILQWTATDAGGLVTATNGTLSGIAASGSSHSVHFSYDATDSTHATIIAFVDGRKVGAVTDGNFAQFYSNTWVWWEWTKSSFVADTMRGWISAVWINAEPLYVTRINNDDGGSLTITGTGPLAVNGGGMVILPTSGTNYAITSTAAQSANSLAGFALAGGTVSGQTVASGTVTAANGLTFQSNGGVFVISSPGNSNSQVFRFTDSDNSKSWTNIVKANLGSGYFGFFDGSRYDYYVSPTGVFIEPNGLQVGGTSAATSCLTATTTAVKIGVNGSSHTYLATGTCALTSGTALVSDTNTLATSRIFVNRMTDAGTVSDSYSVTRVSGTSFTISGMTDGSVNASDTSTVTYLILN